MKKAFLFILFFLSSGCDSKPNPPILLRQLNQLNIEEAGELLINRNDGLYKIERTFESDSSFGIIFVHGYGSFGKEWVKPVRYLSCQSVQTYWYRWDWNQCPDSAAEQLLEKLLAFTEEMNYDSLWILGHSYAGLIVALMSEEWRGNTKLTIHSIAAPLKGMPQSKLFCNFEKQKYNPNQNTKLIQWKTVHMNDNAFNRYENNPQIVEIIDGDIRQLLGEWNGTRLGHNRSISFVSSQLCKD